MGSIWFNQVKPLFPFFWTLLLHSSLFAPRLVGHPALSLSS